MVDFKRLESLGYDSVCAEKRFRGSEEFYTACMNIYFHTDDISRLERLCRDKCWDEALDCVHTLKGASGNLAFTTLYNIYSDMTEHFRAGNPEKALTMLKSARELENALREAAGFVE